MIRKNTQSSQRRIAAAVADDWQMQSLCLGHSKGQCNGWGIVLRCDKVDIVGTFCLQFQKNIGQSLYRNPLAALAGSNGMILAENTAHATAGEKDST